MSTGGPLYHKLMGLLHACMQSLLAIRRPLHDCLPHRRLGKRVRRGGCYRYAAMAHYLDELSITYMWASRQCTLPPPAAGKRSRKS
jgi:hypothetical protein